MGPFPVWVELPVLWGDMDAFGHVNNTRYLVWFECARIAYFEQIGLTGGGASGVGPMLATTTCDYLRPLHYPDTIRVGARVSRVGNTSFTMAYVVVRTEAPDELVAKGSGVVVTLDYGVGEKVRVPDAYREAIERVEGSVGL